MSHSWGKGNRHPRWQWGEDEQGYYNKDNQGWTGGYKRKRHHWQPVLKEGPGGEGPTDDDHATGPHAPAVAPQQQLRVANPPPLPEGVGSGFGWSKDGGEKCGGGEKGGGGSKGGGKNARKGRDALELVQPRYTGIVRSVGTTEKGIDGLIEIDQDNAEAPSRYIHYHSLNWLSATVDHTIAAYRQGWLLGHPVSFLVDSYTNAKGPRGVALGMSLIYKDE